MKEKLAIFDIDYTLTKSETMVELLKYFLKKYPYKFYYAFNSLFGFLGYFFGLIDEKKSKEIHLSFLKGFNKEELDSFIEGYFQNQFKPILLKDGFDALEELKSMGYKVILSSASPEFYVTKLYENKNIDMIMGSKFAFDENGRFLSKMLGRNNKGKEKVIRLNEYIDFEKVDFKNSYMFSDSLSDSPLLELCGKSYLINYKKEQSDYEVLIWK